MYAPEVYSFFKFSSFVLMYTPPLKGKLPCLNLNLCQRYHKRKKKKQNSEDCLTATLNRVSNDITKNNTLLVWLNGGCTQCARSSNYRPPSATPSALVFLNFFFFFFFFFLFWFSVGPSCHPSFQITQLSTPGGEECLSVHPSSIKRVYNNSAP